MPWLRGGEFQTDTLGIFTPAATHELAETISARIPMAVIKCGKFSTGGTTSVTAQKEAARPRQTSDEYSISRFMGWRARWSFRFHHPIFPKGDANLSGLVRIVG